MHIWNDEMHFIERFSNECRKKLIKVARELSRVK